MAEFIQPGPALGNPFASDSLLQAFLRWRLPPDLQEGLAPGLLAFGQRMQEEVQALGAEAEAHPPRHAAFGPWGERVDRIELGGAWRRLREIAAEEGLVSLPYERPEGAFSRVHQFSRLYLFHPDSAWLTGTLAMTDGAVRTLEQHGDARLKERVLRRLLSRDPREAWTAGQWMTEREGGSDISRTATVARKAHGHHGPPGADWTLHGSKWFTTGTATQAALVLARPDGAQEGSDSLGLYWVELFDGEGRLRNIRVDRLLDKSGMRAVPSAQMTLDGAPAWLVGDKGHGVRKLAGLINLARVHHTLYAAAGMRRALALAKDYAARRQAFGRRLLDQPLHAETLACLQVEWEGCFHLAMHLALLLGRIEAGEAREEEAAVLRLLAPAARVYSGRAAVAAANEAAEAFGGAGYVEDTGIPTMVRNILVLPVWEGTTNILSLDVLRAMDRDAAFEPLMEDMQARLREVKDPALGDALAGTRGALERLRAGKAAMDGADAAYAESLARAFAMGLARTYIATLMLEHASWLAGGAGGGTHGRGPAAGHARAVQVAQRWCREPLVRLPHPDPSHRAATRSILEEKA